MNAERLLQHYERLADAPEAIERLRRFILDLAVRGKLAPQNPNDEPARDYKTSDHLGAPLELPGNWQWTEIGEQLELLNGMAFKPTDWAKAGLRIVRIQNLNNAEAPFNFCSPDMARERSLIDNGSFLISWSGTPGTSFGAFIWDRGPAVLNQHIFRCDFKTKAFFPPFLRLAINGRLDEMIAKAHGGVGLQHITKGKLEALLIPLPPLAEQHRIVAKVDELMGLCDRLDAARHTREATRDRLAAASLARLNTPHPDTFHADARFALDALPALTTRPDQIKQLRQTILNLAVRGKLVPQDPNDEPITTTLSNAMARRAALVKAKKVRAKKLDGYGGLEADPNLPSSWVTERLGNLVDPENTISYGVLVPGEEVPDGVPFVRAQDLALSGHPERPNKTIAPEVEQAYARTRLRGGEILVCVVGSIGKLGVVPQSWAGANIARAVARISPISEILREYLLIVLRSDPAQTYFSEATRTLAQPTLNVGLIEQTPIPLPPLAEQRRIVARVDALMTLCDQLEASLTTAAKKRGRLLDALLAEALTPSEAIRLEAAE
ncbi:restriction endonuclease subunit S [Vitreimonas flagellata]|uniref:restriction endonuclease subunit S n=1 Tax=Vitreimonas flagellata TaxID=2560861 RepID=UPI0010750317|nr:restriction endonuclease subunit S [Vitreimonas flagellata]